MSRLVMLTACALIAVASFRFAQADELPVAAFAAAPRIDDAVISPQGRYLALITSIGKVQAVVVQDRSGGKPLHAVLSAGGGLQLLWCNWANENRLLCGLHVQKVSYGATAWSTRVVGVDPDGQNVKVLLEEDDVPGHPLLDSVAAWDVASPSDAMLLKVRQLPDERGISDTRAQSQNDSTLPSVYDFNVLDGTLKGLFAPHAPLDDFLADAHGEIRLGWGPGASGEMEYEVRDPVSHDWHKLSNVTGHLKPIALCAAPQDCAYAEGDSDGHIALWRIDLSDKTAPSVVFSQPSVDLDEPLLARDGHLFGVRYDTDRPMVYYTDAAAANLVGGLSRLLPGDFLQLHSYTSDGRQMIVLASSDIDAGSYYLFDIEKNTLARIGTAYPQLTAAKIGQLMRAVSYPAQDGTTIPGFLTVPQGTSGEHLPLVVLPHGGAAAHDRLEFNLLRAFLVSRGYAVLQVNYRGSSGYGTKWLSDAHGDWAGLPYSDVLDGARWAIKQGIADSKRVCIVGSDYAGYLALLAAERSPDVFHCAVSIGGFSDFALPGKGGAMGMAMGGMGGMGGAGGLGPQGGAMASLDKLRAESPLEHAAEAQIPILLVHGDRDTVTSIEQSRAMDRALSDAHKPHQLVVVDGADHDFSLPADRSTLLTTVAAFLDANIGKGAGRP